MSILIFLKRAGLTPERLCACCNTFDADGVQATRARRAARARPAVGVLSRRARCAIDTICAAMAQTAVVTVVQLCSRPGCRLVDTLHVIASAVAADDVVPGLARVTLPAYPGAVVVVCAAAERTPVPPLTPTVALRGAVELKSIDEGKQPRV